VLERNQMIKIFNSTEEMVAKPFIVNADLDSIIPKLDNEKFAVLKASIKSQGLNVPIDVMTDKTIIDGHNRYRACKELGIHDSDIPFRILGVNGIQEAKEYSIMINFDRRQMNEYEAITWAANVYTEMTQLELAKKINFKQPRVSQVVSVNSKLSGQIISVKESKLLSELKSGEISAFLVLQSLTCAENIDNIIAQIDTKDKVYYKTAADKAVKSNLTPTEVKKFKAEMESKYFELKYDKKSLKQLNTDIDKLENPEFYEKVEKGYHAEVQPLVKKINNLEEKYGENVTIYNVTTEDGYGDAIDYLEAQKGSGKLMAMVIFFKLPADMVAE